MLFRLLRIGLFGALLAGCEEVQTSGSDIESEAYDILNQIIEDNNLNFRQVCAEPIRPETIYREWAAEFHPDDLTFIQETQAELKGRQFEPDHLLAWSTQAHDWKPISIVTQDDSTFYSELSWPMFDRARTRAVVQFQSNANGMLSGEGSTVLYVRVKGRWKRWKVYDAWIS